MRWASDLVEDSRAETGGKRVLGVGSAGPQEGARELLLLTASLLPCGSHEAARNPKVILRALHTPTPSSTLRDSFRIPSLFLDQGTLLPSEADASLPGALGTLPSACSATSLGKSPRS